MTMNQQSLHLDSEFAADAQFGERLVNGLYTMSLAVGIATPEITNGTIVANLSYDDFKHPNPAFHGDTNRVQLTVTEKRETSASERGVGAMYVELFNQNDVLVCESDRIVLSLKQENAA